MPVVDLILIFAAGLAAGTINTVVGSGSLITFPTLLALGYPPVVANVSNTIGLVPGSVSGAIGYREQLAGQSRAIMRLVPWCASGALVGGVLLLALPDAVFEGIVIVLVALAMVLVLLQPRIIRARLERGGGVSPHARWLLPVALFGASIYGGYFGAAQGVIYISILGILMTHDLQRANAIKNVLAAIVNGAAAVLFIAAADPDWTVVALIAVGSVIGGQIGAMAGKRLPPAALRLIIIAIGIVAIVRVVTR
ncbi:MAG TPA: sulfite exporter TauE/SafE family protein [Kofleriaceae bacterium]|nr:sulfite exporter TauE/SafE family protein [Kofleriaceae bacterium]